MTGCSSSSSGQPNYLPRGALSISLGSWTVTSKSNLGVNVGYHSDIFRFPLVTVFYISAVDIIQPVLFCCWMAMMKSSGISRHHRRLLTPSFILPAAYLHIWLSGVATLWTFTPIKWPGAELHQGCWALLPLKDQLYKIKIMDVWRPIILSECPSHTNKVYCLQTSWLVADASIEWRFQPIKPLRGSWRPCCRSKVNTESGALL